MIDVYKTKISKWWLSLSAFSQHPHALLGLVQREMETLRSLQSMRLEGRFWSSGGSPNLFLDISHMFFKICVGPIVQKKIEPLSQCVWTCEKLVPQNLGAAHPTDHHFGLRPAGVKEQRLGPRPWTSEMFQTTKQNVDFWWFLGICGV